MAARRVPQLHQGAGGARLVDLIASWWGLGYFGLRGENQWAPEEGYGAPDRRVIIFEGRSVVVRTADSTHTVGVTWEGCARFGQLTVRGGFWTWHMMCCGGCTACGRFGVLCF